MWRYLIALLTSWSADPAAIDRETPLAYAALATDPAPVLSKYEER